MANDSFYGFNVALRGLYVAQRSLDVINHNLSNVNTPGYSRQQAVQIASEPMPRYDGTGMIGTGATIKSVERIRDEYLDFKYWSENVTMGEWEVKSDLFADIEAIFNEPSDSGFNKIMDGFFGSLQELTKDPSNPSLRALVRENGVTLTKYFNGLANHLERMQSDINYRVGIKVGDVNSLGLQITKLNKQIYAAELDGNVANDLRDQRTVIIDKLAKIVNIEASEVIVGKLPSGKEDKRLLLTISGKPFIDHYDLTKLKVVERNNKLNPGEDIGDLYTVQWEDGNSLNIKGGELKGYIDIRDGNEGENGSPVNKGVPYYLKKLNQFVRVFAMAFNEGYVDKNSNAIIEVGEDGTGHADGYGLDIDGATGPFVPSEKIRFFTMLGVDRNPIDSTTFIGTGTDIVDDPATIGINESIPDIYRNLTAKNFSLSSDILNDLNKISTSDDPNQVGNIVVLNRLIELRHSTTMFSEGAPEDFIKSVITTLAIDSQQSIRITQNQTSILKQVENNRDSFSGVSIDEEMANMVKYQHAYNAAAKMVSTMTEIYDILINRIGVR